MENKLFRSICIFIFIFIFISFGCNRQKEESKLNIPIETIDFYGFEIVENVIPESIFKIKKYILLDSMENVLFAQIDKIRIANDRIYILDKKLKKLVVFDSEGNGIGQVGQRGQGPEEYLQISDFDISSSGNIYFIDGNADKLFVYNENFQFVSSKKMPFEADIIHCLPDNKLIFGLSSWNKGENENKRIAVTDIELVTEETYLQFDEYIDNAYWISDYIFVFNEKNIFYNKPIDDFVYQFSQTGTPVKAFWFDFGKKNVPDEDKKDIEGNKDKYKNYCCLKNFVIISDKYLAGTIRDELKTKTFVIDRDNRKLYISKEIAAGDISNITGYYSNHIISYIYPGKYDNIQTIDFPENVKTHINNDNFVICLNELL
jgi:hypothetical protein